MNRYFVSSRKPWFPRVRSKVFQLNFKGTFKMFTGLIQATQVSLNITQVLVKSPRHQHVRVQLFSCLNIMSRARPLARCRLLNTCCREPKYHYGTSVRVRCRWRLLPAGLVFISVNVNAKRAVWTSAAPISRPNLFSSKASRLIPPAWFWEKNSLKRDTLKMYRTNWKSLFEGNLVRALLK